ncbi:MAG: CerR family C-terminal domain-containing protein [Kiritimatiellaeota bacterium]|nr:CerR family C-terminal domain-containing protein [Kiritimatiellota bacterium]
MNESEVHDTTHGTRDRILQAAGQLFAEKGFHAAGVREISKRARVNIAAVNYHFGSKEQLYEAALRQVFLHRGDLLDAPAEPDSELPPEECLRRYVSAFLEIGLDPARPAWHRALHGREMLEPSPALRRIAQEIIRKRFSRLREIVRRIGRAAPDDPRLDYCTISVLSQCIFYFRGQFVMPLLRPGWRLEPETAGRIAEHITAFSLGALRGLFPESPVDRES